MIRRLFRCIAARSASQAAQIISAGAVIATAALIASAQPAVTAFTLGVLRRDATIVPFANYDGGIWKNYWPDPAASVDVPLNLRSVPRKWWGPLNPIGEWQIWTGPTPQTVHVRQPDWLQTHCQRQIGLRTDYQPRVRPPGDQAQPYPKDGLAVWPAQRIDPVERLSPDSADGKTMLDLLRRGFADREEAAVARAVEQGANVKPTREELDALPITIEALYAAGTTRRAFYVEAVREYKNGPGCATLFGSGWVVVEKGKIAYAGLDVQMVPCDRTSVEYMLPLGVMSLPNGFFWIAQWSDFDREQYSVIEIRANGITPAIGVSGGGC